MDNQNLEPSNSYLLTLCPVGKWRGVALGNMPASSARWFAENFTANPRFPDSLQFRNALNRWAECNPLPQNPPKSEGMFQDASGFVYRVQMSQAGRLYALTLNPLTGKFDFIRGAIGKLDETMRLNLEQCQEIGKAIGRCVVCGARLTDPESVQRGIGRVCASKVAQ